MSGRARGRLVLVFGPSGAGKDSILAAARARLPHAAPVVFARRAITRPGAAGGEAHEPVSWPEFAARRAAGRFLLAWQANGHGYGLPAVHADDLSAGRIVVASVSRTVIGAASRLPWPIVPVRIAAPPTLLAARLACRGRESESAITSRLARAALAEPETGTCVTEIVNDGALDDAVGCFLALLASGQPPNP